jgi:hypothetical protein
VTGSSDAAELKLIKEEKLSAQKCLEICAQLSEHIDKIQLSYSRDGSSEESTDPDDLPEKLTSKGLQDCKTSLSITAAKLEMFMKDRIDRMVAKSRSAMTSEEEIEDLVRLREEWETTLKSRDICAIADMHLQQSVSTIDNYATGDAIQFLVSTDGNVFHGKNRGYGVRTRQVGGHLSDASVQRLSRDMAYTGIANTEDADSLSREKISSTPDAGMEDNPDPEYKERYGRGFKLSPKDTQNLPPPSKDGRSR